MNDNTRTPHDPVQLSILTRLHRIDSRLDHLIETLGPEVVDHRAAIHELQAIVARIQDEMDSRSSTNNKRAAQ